YRFAQHHLFEDRSPPLSRRRSPNDPRDISIACPGPDPGAAPVLCQPRGTESYSGRVAQGRNAATGENVGTFRIRHYIHACPSAFAGMTARAAGPHTTTGAEQTLRAAKAPHGARRGPAGKKIDPRTKRFPTHFLSIRWP